MAALVPSDSDSDSSPDLPVWTVEDLTHEIAQHTHEIAQHTHEIAQHLKEKQESKLTDLKARKAEVQQELINSTSDEYKKQLEGELVTIEEKIIGAVSTIENYEKGIQQIESLLRQQDVEKENCRRKESKRLLNEAMKEGHVLLHIINVILAGVAGSGKTSCLDLLMDNPPKPESERSSTPCMKRPIRVRPITNVRFQSIGNEWKEVNRQKYISLLADAIKHLPRGFQKSLPKDLQKRLQLKSESDGPSGSATGPANPDGKERVGFSVEPKSPAGQAIAAVTELVTEALSEKLSIVKDAKENDVRKPFDPKMVYVTDCGGQPQFQDTGSLFMRHTSAALLVSRLIDELCSFTFDEYFKDGKLVGIPYSSHITQGETLMSLLRSLRSHNHSGKNPICLFIGTFLDHLKSMGILDKRNEALLEMLPPEILQDVVFSDRGMNELIFPVNTLSRDQHSLAIAQAIRKAVESAPPLEVKVPVLWFLIELALQELCSILGRGVLTFAECCALAHGLGFQSAVLDAALDFFDEVCIAHYYPMVLPNTVFVNPQVPLDKVSELTEHAISLREAKDGRGDKSSIPTAMDHKWKRFRDEGIVTLDILSSEEFQKHYQKGLFAPTDFLLVMQQLLIIAPISIPLLGKIAGPYSEAEFFMPTLLRSLPPSELEELRVLDSTAAPLLIRFPSDCIRFGVFCCLVVYLMTKYGWQVSLPSSRDPALLAKNCVTFSQVEVYVKARPKVCADLCPTIRENLLEGVDKACQALHYNNDRPVTRIFCPHTKEQNQEESVPLKRHSAEVDFQAGSWCCTAEFNIDGELQLNHMVWWERQPVISTYDVVDQQINEIAKSCEVGINPQELDKSCSQQHLLPISQQLEHWSSYADHLGLTSSEKQDILQNLHLTAPYEKGLEMLKVWQKKCAYTSKANYRYLLRGCIILHSNSKLVGDICKLLK